MLTLIARQSAGGMRDAISLLDQMASTGKEITLILTQTVLGTATSQTVIELVQALQARQPAAGMQAIHSALDSGSDPRLLARQVVDYLRALLLIQMGNGASVDLAADTRKQAEKHAKAFTAGELLMMIQSFNAAATDLRGGWQPALPLEMALAESLEMPANTKKPAAPALVENPPPPAKKAREVPAQPAGAHEMQPPAAKPAAKITAKPVEPAGTSETGITLTQVVNAWRQICLEVKSENPNLNALLNSGHPINIKGNLVVVGFSSEILRSKADLPEQMETTRRAIAKVLGADMQVKCVVSNTKQASREDVKADGMVAAALKHGGEIVDIQE